MLTGRQAIDLYAGVGLFSWSMAGRFERVTAVESSDAAVADLMHNVPKADAVGRRSTNTSPQSADAPDFVLADPPRSGLGKHAVRHLLRMKPKRIHIVACDPATLARDMAQLLAAGYQIERMILVDLFPQTYHLETVVRLSL